MPLSLFEQMPQDWQEAVRPFWPVASVADLERRLQEEIDAGKEVYPPVEKWFAALYATPVNSVKVVLIGQDPYHEPGQAMGLAFSVPDGVKQPPSLKNLLKELKNDLGPEMVPACKDGSVSLKKWAANGVLLINAVLTVRRGEAGSHHRFGWQSVTDALLQAVNSISHPVGFLLLGKDAAACRGVISPRHPVVMAAHPSPLSASRGFFGSRPFSRMNQLLMEAGAEPVCWQL